MTLKSQREIQRLRYPWNGIKGSKELASLARRKPKIFFRKARSNFIIPMKSNSVPAPVDKLAGMMNGNNVWHCTIVDLLQAHPEKPILETADEGILGWAKVVRCKAHGPDGNLPYLCRIIPDKICHWMCDFVRMVPRGALTLDMPREAVVFPLSIGEEDLSVSVVWHPISIATALHGISFRCIKQWFDNVVATNLSPRQ